jgi:hypothetical protein
MEASDCLDRPKHKKAPCEAPYDFLPRQSHAHGGNSMVQEVLAYSAHRAL